MQLLEPTDSLFRVGRLFALLHQPLLQLRSDTPAAATIRTARALAEAFPAAASSA